MNILSLRKEKTMKKENNKRILFVLDTYLPKPFANAVCAQNLIDEYVNNGFDVDIVCLEQPRYAMPKNYGGHNIYAVKPNMSLNCFLLSQEKQKEFSGKLYRIFGRILSCGFKLLFLPLVPLNSFSLPRRYSKCIEKLLMEKQYFGIVSTLSPLEGNLGISRLRAKGKLNIPWVIFCFDTFVDVKGRLHKNVYSRHYKSPLWYKYLLSKCNGYLFVESRSDEYDQNDLKKWSSKLAVSDLPMITIDKKYPVLLVDIDEKAENFGYFGSIGGEHYPYSDLLDFFFSLPNDRKRVLHFFIRGAIFKNGDFKRENDFKKIVIHGYVDQDHMINYMEKMDYLISLKYTDQISAKIFQYISMRKKIIHFSGAENDPDVHYLNKYDNCLLLKPKEMTISQMINLFELKKWSLQSDKNSIQKCFEKNDPKYSCKVISSFFDNFYGEQK